MFRLTFWMLAAACAYAQEAPLRVAIAGLNHGHVSGFLRNAKPRTDLKIVAVYDPDPALTKKYGEAGPGFNDLAKMPDQVKPEAVATFTSTFDHAAIVEACARRCARASRYTRAWKRVPEGETRRARPFRVSD